MFNKIILFALNVILIGTPYGFMNVIKKALEATPRLHQDPMVYFLVAAAFTVTAFIFEYAVFWGLSSKNSPNMPPYFRHMQHFCIITSSVLFAAVIAVSCAFLIDGYKPAIAPQIMILCTFTCIIIGGIAGFLKYNVEDNAIKFF